MAAKITNIRSCCGLLNYRYCTRNIVSFTHRGLLSSPYVQAKVKFSHDLYCKWQLLGYCNFITSHPPAKEPLAHSPIKFVNKKNLFPLEIVMCN